MCDLPPSHEYDRLELLQRIRINIGDHDTLYSGIEQGIDDRLSPERTRKVVLNTRMSIQNYFKERQIQQIIHHANVDITFNREKIKDVNGYVQDLIARLEVLQVSSDAVDPAVIGDLDIGDDASMQKVFNDVKQTNTGGRLYKCGLQALNHAMGGGFRPGDFVNIGALQHKNKTGFTLSLFMDFARFNQPFTIDPTKKPLLLRISFEDDLDVNLQYMYQALKYDETREHVNKDALAQLSTSDMAKYVKEKLQVNGFHIKMMRVDPNQWTYKSICNQIITYESMGYAVEILALDYLSKISTAGCAGSGAIGSDLCELFSRIRNFCSARKILCINPHQLSTEAKMLLRNGTPESEFVKIVANRGFFERSKALDQIYDVGLFIHLFKHQRETYFTIQKEKHRGGPIIDEDDKYFMYRFPAKSPIPSDINEEDSSFKRLPSAASNASDDLFKLG
jgi:hypothetical protein